MKIKIVQSVVESLLLERSEEVKGRVDINYEVLFSEEDPKSFIIAFDVKIDTVEGRNIKLKYVSFFDADEDIPESEHNSLFFKINAPAIAYPFLRAYVANLMLSSGFQPVMLPTINFVELAKAKDQAAKKGVGNPKSIK